MTHLVGHSDNTVKYLENGRKKGLNSGYIIVIVLLDKRTERVNGTLLNSNSRFVFARSSVFSNVIKTLKFRSYGHFTSFPCVLPDTLDFFVNKN